MFQGSQRTDLPARAAPLQGGRCGWARRGQSHSRALSSVGLASLLLIPRIRAEERLPHADFGAQYGGQHRVSIFEECR
jgi:hypothetical protein